MKLFWKSIATVLFYVISSALLVYAASRSLDFVVKTLPADQAIIGYLALAATSGGMIAWLLVFMYKAEGLGQKVTAGIMVVVDMLGEFGLFTMDTLLQSGKAGMTAQLSPEDIQMVILGMSGLIALNILATVIFHLVDSNHMRTMREGFVKDKLENDALDLVEKRGNELAGTLAPRIAEQWAADFEARFSDMNALGLGTLKTNKPASSATAETNNDNESNPTMAKVQAKVEEWVRQALQTTSNRQEAPVTHPEPAAVDVNPNMQVPVPNLYSGNGKNGFSPNGNGHHPQNPT